MVRDYSPRFRCNKPHLNKVDKLYCKGACSPNRAKSNFEEEELEEKSN